MLEQLIPPSHLPIGVERVVYLELIMPAGVAFIGKVAGGRLDNAEVFIPIPIDSFWRVVIVFVGLQTSQSHNLSMDCDATLNSVVWPILAAKFVYAFAK